MLEGVKVLNFTHYLQGPSAGQTLGDLGADVVKVESLKGAYERSWSGCNTYKNGVSVFFLMANRNQRDLSLDLKSAEGREIIHRLVTEKGFDVVLENFRPGVMDKLGLGYEDLKKICPRVIYCSCTGYGSSGPKVAKPGQDILIQSMSGMAALGGPGDHPPTPAGTALVDQHGAMLAALGIVSAVYDRSKTGKGHRIEASLLASSFDLQIEPLNYFLSGAKLSPRTDSGLCTRFHQSPYGVYRTKDSYITVSLNSFDKLKKVFSPGVLDAYTPADQMEKRVDFDKLVRDELLKQTTKEWCELFEAEGLWYAPVNEYDEVLKDEQVIYNDPFITMRHPVAGEVRVLGHANKYDGKTLPLRRLPPDLGEHTAELLREAGYSDEKISRLSKEGKVFLGK
ncbi:CoA transferase [Betaproteobacteria bacterium]|nr:CoA transferase [Betaproteobacteria bacterium]